MKIVDQIIESLQQATLRPGDRLPTEGELSTMFQSARASVREALACLKLVGVTTSRPGSGTYISEEMKDSGFLQKVTGLIALLQEQNPLDVLEVRLINEPEATALSAIRATDQQKREIERSLYRLEELRDNSDEAMEQDSKFHLAIARASHNRVLLDTISHVHSLMRHQAWTEFKVQSLREQRYRDLYRSQHRRILEAIRAGDDVGARDIMTKHLVDIKVHLLETHVVEDRED